MGEDVREGEARQVKISVPTREEREEGWRSPGEDAGWRNPFVHRFLLDLLVHKEIHVRYRGSVLGMLWSYVKPATQFLVFYLALGVFLQLNKGMSNYALYLFSGIVVINLFGEIFGNATRSITGNNALVSKIYLPTELFPYATMRVALTHFWPQLLVLVVAGVIMGWRPGFAEIGAFLLAMVILLAFTLGLGMMAAAVNATYRDTENLVDLIVMVATWLSPIMYRIDMVRATVHPWLYTLYEMNPLTIVVQLFHMAFWRFSGGVTEGVGDSMHLWWFGILLSVVVFLLGNIVFGRAKRGFAEAM